MKLLIVGGAGYIGAHVALAAVDYGFEVTVYDNLCSGSIENLNQKCKFIEGSTSDSNLLNKLMKSQNFDAVLHFAAYKSASESMSNPWKYAENNIVGSLALINSCVSNGIKNFIFSSSAAVYGSPQYLPIDEMHPTNPINYYGYTKLEIENNLKWFNQIAGLNYVCLRYFNAAGYDPRNRIRVPERNPENLIPIVMESAIGIRKKIEVYGNDYKTKDGTGIRDYIHVADLASAHISSIEYLNKSKKSITINLGTGVGYSVLDVIKKTSEISKKEVKYEFKKRRKGDAGEVVAKSLLAHHIIDWKPNFSDLESIIQSTWSVYKTLINKL